MRIKGKLNIVSKKFLCSAAASIAAGGIVSLIRCIGEEMVLTPALAASLSAGAGAFSLLGALISAAVFGIRPLGAAALAAGACCVLVRLWFDNVNRRSYPAAASVTALFVYTSGGLLYSMLSGFDGIIRTLILSLVCSASVFLFTLVFKSPSISDMFRADDTKLCAISVIAVGAISGFSSVPVFGIMTYCFVLLSAIYSRPRYKSVILAAVASLGLMSGSGEIGIGMIGMAGVLTAALCPRAAVKNRALLSVFVTFAMGLFSCLDYDKYGVSIIIGCAAASVLFCVIPNRIFYLFKGYAYKCDGRETVIPRFSVLAETMEKLSSECESDSESYSDHSAESIEEMVYVGVCIGCEGHDRCFSDGDMSEKKVCIHPDTVRKYAEQAQKKLRYSSDSSVLLTSRRKDFANVAGMLSSLALDFSVSDSRCAELKRQIISAGINVLDCSIDRDDVVTVYLEKGSRFIEAKLNEIISEFFEASSNPNCRSSYKSVISSMTEYTGFTRLVFVPYERLSADCCAYSVAKSEGEPSGDAYSVFSFGKYTYAVLCDGMGTGEEAAECANALIGALKPLLQTELSVESCLRLVSEYIRSRFDECFATLDMLRINRVTGELVSYKCGAAPSCLFGEGSIDSVPQAGYPLGIIEELTMSEKKIDSGNIETVVMMTDGGGALSVCDVKTILSEGTGLSSTELSARLAKRAYELQNADNRDDVTVMVCKINSSI